VVGEKENVDVVARPLCFRSGGRESVVGWWDVDGWDAGSAVPSASGERSLVSRYNNGDECILDV
jgi:hypothetical protein